MISFSFLPKNQCLVIFFKTSEDYVLPKDLLQECFTITNELDQKIYKQVVFVGEKDFWHKNVRIDSFLSLYDCMNWAKQWRIFLKKIKELPVPTYAFIQGQCESVGLELALACHYRIAHYQANFTCQDVRHGHLPVGGSLFRLISLVGVNEALNFLLLGLPVSATKAQKSGLIHGQSLWFFDERDMPVAHLHQRHFHFYLEDLPWARGFLFRRWRQIILNRFRGHFRSPLKLMEVIERGWFKGGETRAQLEIEAFSELVFSSQAHVLEYVHSRLRTLYKTQNISHLRGVICGNGAFCSEVASLFSSQCSMSFYDSNPSSLEDAAKTFSKKNALVELSCVFPDENNFDFVLEKKEDTGYLYQCRLPKEGGSFLIRFFYPLRDRKIIEIYSEDKRSSFLSAVLFRLGKIPLQIKGNSPVVYSPVVRLAVSLFQEAQFLFAQGHSLENIKAAWKDMGMQPDIFEIWRESCLDQFLFFSQELNGLFPERFWTTAPCQDKLVVRTDLKDFFTYRLLKESLILLEEKIVQDPFLVDLLMIYGLGFPRYQGGLLSLVDQDGPEIWLDGMQLMTKKFGARFSPPQFFIKIVEEKRQIYDCAVL